LLSLCFTGLYWQSNVSRTVNNQSFLLLEDIHGDLIDAYLELNRLRGRISKMGLQIQSDVINEEAEADKRGLMNPRTAVHDRFESAKDDAAAADDEMVGRYR